MLWLAQTGPGMTAAEIDFVAASKFPIERDWNGGGLRGTSSLLMESLYPVVGPNASVYLLSAGFIGPAAQGTFKITEQGIALLRGTMRQSEGTNAVFKLDPEAPLDYIGLLSELDSLENPLVIDPYFHPYDLEAVVDAMPGVRLITVDRYVEKVEAFQKPKLKASLKQGQFEEILGRREVGDSVAEVIYVPAQELHDRYFLGANRKGYFAGGSFRSNKPTVVMELEPEHASDLYAHYETVATADGAKKLEPRTRPESGEQTEA